MSLAVTWMNLDIVILSEVSQRQISYNVTYMWNLFLKSGRNETIYKTEIKSQMQKTNIWLSRGKGEWVGGINWEIEIDITYCYM